MSLQKSMMDYSSNKLVPTADLRNLIIQKIGDVVLTSSMQCNQDVQRFLERLEQDGIQNISKNSTLTIVIEHQRR